MHDDDKPCPDCGVVLRKYAKSCKCGWSAPTIRRQRSPAVDTCRCIADGCPLPGSISDSTTGGGPWTCTAHRWAAPRDWPRVSERLRILHWLWKLQVRLLTDGREAYSDAVRELKEGGREDLLMRREAGKDESYRAWAARIADSVVAEAMTGIRPVQRIPTAPVSGNSVRGHVVPHATDWLPAGPGVVSPAPVAGGA